MNISFKKVKTEYNIDGSDLFAAMALVCTVLTLPIILLYDSYYPESTPLNSFKYTIDGVLQNNYHPLFLMFVAAMAYHVEYSLNFIFVGYVSPVAFSVSDIARRLAIIIIGAFLFNKVLTSNNWIGIIIALGGVGWYTLLENERQKAIKVKVK